MSPSVTVTVTITLGSWGRYPGDSGFEGTAHLSGPRSKLSGASTPPPLPSPGGHRPAWLPPARQTSVHHVLARALVPRAKRSSHF